MPSLAARNIERARKINCHICLHYLLTACVSYTLSKLIVTLGYNEDEHKLSLSLNVGKIIIYVQSINQKKEEKNRLICLRLFQNCNLILLRQTHFN